MKQELKFGLPFFAAIMLADLEKLNYVIISRKYNDGFILRRPGIAVSDINEYAFDIAEGQFVKIGQREDSIITIEYAGVLNENKKYFFLGKDNLSNFFGKDSLFYPEEDFIKTYSVRVVNDTLK